MSDLQSYICGNFKMQSDNRSYTRQTTSFIDNSIEAGILLGGNEIIYHTLGIQAVE
jgi:hypothetical protein